MRNGAPEAVRLTDEALAVIRQLIRTCDNAAEGFLAAASDVHDPALRSVFLDLVRERQRCCAELTDVVRGAGSALPEDGTVFGALHRRWMDVKHLVDHGDSPIINACGLGERAAEHEYRLALQREWPPRLHAVLTRHLQGIRRTRSALEGLAAERALRHVEEDELVEREVTEAIEKWEAPPLT